MYINSASVDDNLTFVECEYGAQELTSDLIADLIRSLDGNQHSLVILSPGGEAHMAVGGDAGIGLIVYMTSDNVEFHNLYTRSDRSGKMISLVAGGQPGEYDPRNVVTLQEALIAAICYAEKGELSDELHWEVQQPG